ncbi:POK25 protein, partial [Ibidorhyncha struthersii]|nr:POK25 protein [Ibidorhyncha struthersii]
SPSKPLHHKSTNYLIIPLNEQDMEKFAFTVPSVNNSNPAKRYHWKVLPQGMKNSPTICQWFVAKALSPVRAAFSTGYCYRYMDDNLLAPPSETMSANMENEAH